MGTSKYIPAFLFVFTQLVGVGAASADTPQWLSTFKENVAETWQQPQHYDLYIPAITWHARFAYDKEKIEHYNERPWGGGVWSVPVG